MCDSGRRFVTCSIFTLAFIMKISIIHPSRSRPTQAAATAKAWLSSAKDRGNVEYSLSLDNNDSKLEQYFEPILDLFKKMMPLENSSTIFTNDNKSAIDAINYAARFCTGDLLIVVSDDFSTPPFHWDAALLEALEGKEDFLVKTQDGIQRTLITLPIMDRVYYNRFGYIYNPEYLHMSSDVELTAVGHLLGKIITLPMTIKHNHYSVKGGQPKDAVNIKNDQTYAHGHQTYERRKHSNFGLPADQIVNSLSTLVW